MSSPTKSETLNYTVPLIAVSACVLGLFFAVSTQKSAPAVAPGAPVAQAPSRPNVGLIETRLDRQLGAVRASPWRKLSTGDYERALPDLQGALHISAIGDDAESIEYFSHVPRDRRNAVRVIYPAHALVGAAIPEGSPDAQVKLARRLAALVYVGEFGRVDDAAPGRDIWVQADDDAFVIHAGL